VGRGGYVKPITVPSGRNGAGGGKEGGSGKEDNSGNFIELPNDGNVIYSEKVGNSRNIIGVSTVSSSIVKDSTENLTLLQS
jgi:hypothetical protein